MGTRYGSVVVLLALASCIGSNSVVCGDRLCPEGTTCRQLTDPDQSYCATVDELAACTSVAEGAACTTGWCHDGVCLPIVCGNNRIDLGETCDDGNTVTGDGTCSGDCTSNETCGNGQVDPLRMGHLNEQCDDGNFLSSDGCSSRCFAESPRWDQIILAQPVGLDLPAMAYDSVRRRVVMFGGRYHTAQGDFASAATYEWDGKAWIGMSTPVHPAARWNARMAYDASRHRTVMFGGQDIGGSLYNFGDTWEWDGARWTNASPTVAPIARIDFGMAYDSARKVTVLFGGDTTLGPNGETWEWNGMTWAQQTGSPSPAARYFHVMAYDPKRARIVVAGGIGNNGDTLDTWEYDGTWHMSVAAPAEVFRTSMAYDPVGQRLIAYGGGNGTVTSNTWSYDGQAWTNLGQSGPGPRAQIGIATDAVGGRVVLYGGITDLNAQPPADTRTWTWNGSTWLAPVAPPIPPVAIGTAQGYDPAHAVFWSYGGLDVSKNANAELWSFDGVTWTSYAAAQPGPRFSASAVFDTARGELVMFGGAVDNEQTLAPNDTWIWNGASWHKATPVHSPPARTDAAMVYDPKRHRTVLFGGDVLPALTFLDDTWEWDGTDWHDVSTSPNPGIRGGAAGTYDPAHGTLVQNGFHIVGMAAAFDNDLWAWDGTAWTELDVAIPTQNRGLMTLVYSPGRRHTIVIGGVNAGGTAYDETWEWDGSGWTEVSPAITPGPLGSYDAFPARDGSSVIVFGGTSDFDNATFSNAMWRLSYTNDAPLELCTASVDNDGDGLSGCADPDCWAECTPLCPPNAPCDPAAPKCGDGVCSAVENCRICAQDCQCTAVCGDTFCDAGETHASCPGDCP